MPDTLGEPLFCHTTVHCRAKYRKAVKPYFSRGALSESSGIGMSWGRNVARFFFFCDWDCVFLFVVHITLLFRPRRGIFLSNDKNQGSLIVVLHYKFQSYTCTQRRHIWMYLLYGESQLSQRTLGAGTTKPALRGEHAARAARELGPLRLSTVTPCSRAGTKEDAL